MNSAKNFILDLTLSQGGECFFFHRSVITSLLHVFSWLSQGFSDNEKMCSGYINPSMSSCVHSDLHVIHYTIPRSPMS